MTTPRTTIAHGTVRGYVHRGCRCRPCCEANTADCGARKSARRERTRASGDIAPAIHGTANAYRNYGCRCETCRQAGSEWNRAVRARRLARAS